MQAVDPALLIAFFEQRIPFNAWLQVKVEALGDGTCTLRVPFRPELVGDPLRPALHGGVMSTLADAAGGLAVFSTVDWLQTRVSTIDLRVDYLRAGLLQDLICEARVLRVGNRVGVTSMIVHHGDPAYVAAEARGVYSVVRREAAP